ncbi:hypothetical protein DIPPA_65107, partial [Diplonema papillatum]
MTACILYAKARVGAHGTTPSRLRSVLWLSPVTTTLLSRDIYLEGNSLEQSTRPDREKSDEPERHPQRLHRAGPTTNALRVSFSLELSPPRTGARSAQVPSPTPRLDAMGRGISIATRPVGAWPALDKKRPTLQS